MFFCNRCDVRQRRLHLFEGVAGGVQMSQPAVYQHQVRPQLFARQRILIPSLYHLGYHRVIIAALYRFYSEAPVAVFEWPAVDKFNQRADGLGAGYIGNVNTLDNSDGLGGL